HRSQVRRDHLGRREHLPRRDRSGARRAREGGGRGRVRDPRRRVGREREGTRRARERRRAGRRSRERAPRVLPRATRVVQSPAVDRFRRRASARREREALQTPAARSVLGRAREEDLMTNANWGDLETKGFVVVKGWLDAGAREALLDDFKRGAPP